MRVTFVIIIIVIVIILLQFIFKKLDLFKDNAIKNLEDGVDKIYKIIDKESNIYYIEDLKNIKIGKDEDIDISNLDSNIATINTKEKYNYTFKVNLCNNICINLQASIEYLFVKDNCFVVCFQRGYIGALIFNENNIVITNQNFDELEEMRKLILGYIHSDSNIVTQEDKNEQ